VSTYPRLPPYSGRSGLAQRINDLTEALRSLTPQRSPNVLTSSRGRGVTRTARPPIGGAGETGGVARWG
jgi:hypothetical protein